MNAIRNRRLWLGIFLVAAACLSSGCKKDPITATLSLGPDAIALVCSPATDAPGAIVTVAVVVSGNSRDLRVFGLAASFDPRMFEFQSVAKGSLNASWAAVDGNEISPGSVKVGGYAGGGSAIPKNSTGTLAAIKLKVTGSTYGNGEKSRILISDYTDDLVGFQPESASVVFTLKKS